MTLSANDTVADIDVVPSSRLLIVFIVAVGFMSAAGVVLLTATNGDMLGPLFRYVLTGKVLIGLVAWTVLAFSAQRLVVGKLPKLQLTSKFALAWGGSRIGLLLAVVALLLAWLTALSFGLEAKTTLLRAMVLLMVVTAATGILGGAFINSMLVLSRWHSSKPE